MPLISRLVCAVSYTTQYGEKLYFRKFFKFQVSREQQVAGCSDGQSLNPWPSFGGSLRNVASPQPGSGRCPAAVLGPLLASFRVFSSRYPEGFRARLAARTLSVAMEPQFEKPTAFSLHSIFNQVLKPLDVKTKFYNAEVSSVSVSGMRITSFCR